MAKDRKFNSDRVYFTIIPNIVDDSELSVYAFRLYFHLKRVAGEDGRCFQSTETLAEKCKMSVGSVSDAKKELVEAGLIGIEYIPTYHGGRASHNIIITDIWKENIEFYLNQKASTSPDEIPGSPNEVGSSSDEVKKNPVNNNPVNNNNTREEENEPVWPVIENPVPKIEEEDVMDWFTARETPQPEREHLTAEERKQRVASVLLAGEQQRAGMDDNAVKIRNFCNDLPERIRGVALAFCQEFGRPPLPGEKSGWIKAWNDQATLGLSPTDIEQAMRYMREPQVRMNIKWPGSVTGLAEEYKKLGTLGKKSSGRSSEDIFKDWQSKINSQPTVIDV